MISQAWFIFIFAILIIAQALVFVGKKFGDGNFMNLNLEDFIKMRYLGFMLVFACMMLVYSCTVRI